MEARAKEEKEKRKEIKDRKGKNEEAETEDLNGVEEHEEYEENEDEEIDPRAESLTPSFPPKSEPDAFKYLRSVWQDINLPTPEDELIGRFYGAIYYDMRRRPLLYIGRVQRRFLKDAEGPASELTLDCLSLAVSTATVLKEPPIHLRDVGEFTVDNIIAGPVEATLMNLGKMVHSFLSWYRKVLFDGKQTWPEACFENEFVLFLFLVFVSILLCYVPESII